MKFDCGPKPKIPEQSEEGERRLQQWLERCKVWMAKRQHLTKWHPWFAWYPVKIKDNDCRFLEHLERKIEYWEHGMLEHRRFYRTPKHD
jgi:hypothetical protein